MPNLTLAVPEELHRIMKNHPEIKWSEIARHAIREYASQLKLMNDIVSKSKLTEQEASEIGEAAKRNLSVRYKRIMRRKKHTN